MVDVASIVPSMRDFLQAIATRRKRLSLVPLVDSVDDARAMVEAGAAAIAMKAPGDAMAAVSAAIGTTPLILLAPIGDDEAALVARASGADAVIVDARFDGAAWDAIAKGARATRMAVLSMATDHDSAKRAASTAAKGAYLKLYGVEPIASVSASLAAPLRVLAHVTGIDEAGLRAMRGVVDAAIVESDLYLSTSFATLKDELDP